MNKKIKFISLLCIFLFCFNPILFSQDVTINEIMSSNSATIADADNDYPDWIELYNNSNHPVNLQDYGLSDDEDEPFKWTFPNVTLEPEEILLVFASDKDSKAIVSHWETIINWADSWHYHLGDPGIPSDWNTLEFDDSLWSYGPSGFGYNDNDDLTIVPQQTLSIFVRKSFNINDLSNITAVALHVDYDDGFVAYLNGVEIARANIGSPGIPPAYNDYTISDREAEIYQGGSPEKFIIDSPQTLLQEGENVLAIQVHNVSSTSSDLSLIPFFSLGMSETPDEPSGAPELLKLKTLKLHTNFKINSSGEKIILSEPNGTIADTVDAKDIPIDVSWGRRPDGTSNWFLFNEPTPGTSNETSVYFNIADEPIFSHQGGFYTDYVFLQLSTDTPNSTIRYTKDGSEPTEASYSFSGQIILTTTTVVRAKVFSPDFLPSKTISHTYFFNADTTMPVVSLSTTPDNLFDVENGLYTLGTSYNSSSPNYGANFWQDWECPVHVEFYEPNRALGFSMDAGLKIVGGWSRASAQKPLAVFARNQYGYGEIDYQLFKDLPFDEFQAFILRNGGNDWGRTFFSDGLMQSLVEDIDIDIMAFRPCVVYINGQHWGFLNLREKQNEHYIAMHHDVDPDNIDLLEANAKPIHGDAQNYHMLIDFVSNNDMIRADNYEYVKTLMDVNNYINYNVAQIYFDNRDWPGNNIKYWRPRTDDGKWRWLLYDTDWGFGVNAYGNGGNSYPYDYNTLAFALSPQQTPNHHGNPPWSTLLLRKLVENEEFKIDFINRFADHFNTIFKPDVVLEKLYEIRDIIEPEIPDQISKWHQSYPLWSQGNIWWSNISTWYDYVQIMIDFANNRVSYMRDHVIDTFGLSGDAFIGLNVAPEGAGMIKISTIIPDEYPWQGKYFMNIPIQVTAIPNENYVFDRWSGISSSNSPSTTIELTGNSSLFAVFQPKTDLDDLVVINEINYNSHPDFNPGDWIELYNNTDSTKDLSGWKISDSNIDNSFIIPDNTLLESHKCLILYRDKTAFTALFPDVENVIGDLDFGLSRTGDSIILFNSTDDIIDSVEYSNRPPWPVMADGGGPTLELKDPNMNNSYSISWTASENHGTPGTINGL